MADEGFLGRWSRRKQGAREGQVPDEPTRAEPATAAPAVPAVPAVGQRLDDGAVAALALGASKRAAAEFSFFLSMPTMAGAFAFDLLKSRDMLSGAAWSDIAVGFVCAFLAALAVVRTLLGYVSRRGYAIFAWWRIVVGSLAIMAFLAGR